MNKVVKAVQLGWKILAGASTTYFVMRATEQKAQELAENGGVVNAFVIGAGQGALAAVAGTLAFWTLG